MPPRILLVDDEEQVRRFCADALKNDPVEVLGVASPDDALEVTGSGRFDLFVIDVRLPRMSGFQLRDKLRAKIGDKVPILFLTGADAGIEIEIAHSLKGDKLLIKPVSVADLRRAVKVALKLVRAEAGPIPESLDRIFAAAARDKESGVLSAVNGPTLKRVVFRDGKIAFAASNDPREVIGQAFVRSGLITEKELSAALSQREASGGKPLGIVLTALRKVTRDQAERIFSRKIREAVLELFLWRKGMVEFVGSVEDEPPFPIALEIEPLLQEGKKRRAKWNIVQQVLPDATVKFKVKKWPPGFPKNEGDRVLAGHIESGRSMAEIMVELRGQDYAVGVRLAELVKNGALAPTISSGFSGALQESVTVDIDEALSAFEADEGAAKRDVEDGMGVAEEIQKSTRVLPDPPKPATLGDDSLQPLDFDEYPPKPVNLAADAVQPLEDEPAKPEPRKRSDSIQPPGGMPETVGMLTRSLVLMRAGDLTGARAGIVEVLALDPMNPLARQRLAEIDDLLTAQTRVQSGLTPGTRVQLGIRPEELVGRQIEPNDAFVLTRLAGTSLTLGELTQICPMPERDVWQIVQRHLDSGVLKKA